MEKAYSISKCFKDIIKIQTNENEKFWKIRKKIKELAYFYFY